MSKSDPAHKFHDLPRDGLVRLNSILGPDGPIPVSRSTWYAGVKAKRFPQPVRLGQRTTAWRVSDIRELIARGLAGAPAAHVPPPRSYSGGSK